eukprot:scaffold9776_cov126-Isochrysis_galbana.AAC.5
MGIKQPSLHSSSSEVATWRLPQPSGRPPATAADGTAGRNVVAMAPGPVMGRGADLSSVAAAPGRGIGRGS